MLVLSRRILEEIVINGDIRIRVASIDGKSVKLGISAPKNVIVMRSELVDGGAKTRPEAEQQTPGGVNIKTKLSSTTQ